MSSQEEIRIRNHFKKCSEGWWSSRAMVIILAVISVLLFFIGLMALIAVKSNTDKPNRTGPLKYITTISWIVLWMITFLLPFHIRLDLSASCMAFLALLVFAVTSSGYLALHDWLGI
jgi:uncharacterized membrane-anchored protein